MARANLNKSVWLVTNTTTASKYIPKRTRICINWNPPFQTSLHKIFKNCFIWSKSCFTMFTFIVGLKWGDFNSCRLWASYICILMLWWYLSPAICFYSDFPQPYCDSERIILNFKTACTTIFLRFMGSFYWVLFVCL